MNKYYILFPLFFFFIKGMVIAQNTVGLISIDKEQAFEGYNLFYSHNQLNVYLVNNCGEMVHSWEGEDGFSPGNSAYLLENGDLIKAKRGPNGNMDSIWAGGAGAIVERSDWDNNLIWSFELNNEQSRLHHDFSVMPNGNVLMIAWEYKSKEEALKVGRSPELLFDDKLWPDYVLEYNPDLDTIVWEWHVWDHLIQDFDDTKDNFGKVVMHPELVDINYTTNSGRQDWLHTNAIDYNADLDQILLTVPYFDEVWIIDHSTTTEEAKTHSGGNSGKGGDLLFRWGNPEAYKLKRAQHLFFPHDAHWAKDFLKETDTYYGSIAVFNNRIGENYSAATIIQPELEVNASTYRKRVDHLFFPVEPTLNLFHPDTFSLFSSGLSSVQVLPNGNILTFAGRIGQAFEFLPSGTEIVWDYIIPIKGGNFVEQGAALTLGNNITFRLEKYPLDYSAFIGRDLSPKGYLELNPSTEFCGLRTSLSEVNDGSSHFSVFPNPAQDFLIFEKDSNSCVDINIYNQIGRIVKQTKMETERIEVNISDLDAGIYFADDKNGLVKKIVVQKKF